MYWGIFDGTKTKKFTLNIYDTMTDIMVEAMKTTHPNRYITSLVFVGNGREGEKLCSSEVVYSGIFFITVMDESS